MKANSLLRSRVVKLAGVVLGVVGLGAGCLNRPIEPVNPVTAVTVVEQLTQSGVDKIDLLFVVDNSSSMADKQAILALAVPDLIGGLLNPPCIKPSVGGQPGQPVPTAQQPSGPEGKCPAGSTREFPAVLDVHVGMITSSLGSFGANGCPDTNYDPACTSVDTSNNDHGHLVTRTNPCATTVVPTYTVNGNPEGFLAWDPGQTLKPPGEAVIGDPTATPPVPGLATSLHDLVVGAGQSGCGFESQNEAWYRFLVDPSPYGTAKGDIQLNDQGVVEKMGSDTFLLQQRKEFLRPDSLLAIVVLTDETDTSIKEYGQYPLVAQLTDGSGNPYYLPLPRQDCQTKGPLDRCCASCGAPTPTGCDVDPTCTVNGKVAMYDANTENPNIRAFGLSGGLMSQKARFGIEFFYPPSRYVDALTSGTVQNAAGEMVQNPIFTPAPGTTGTVVRGQNLVFYAAITGVPWQLIARQDANGTPDLVSGLYVDPVTKMPSAVGGFKSFDELSEKDKFGNTFWDDIVGDPENYVPPLSPFMQESTVPRTGTDPITGIAMSPPTAGPGPNPINGHEWNIAEPPGDIEYACIFPVAGTPAACPAFDGTDNPLCTNGLQTSAKAYPGVKNLAIAKGMQGQGIAASICAKQLTTPNNADGSPAQDYGYRPAVNAIIDSLKKVIAAQCLPIPLTPDTTGKVPCIILEARDPMGAECNCDGAARAEVPTTQADAVTQAKESLQMLGDTQDSCICQITQSNGADLTACETQTGAPTDPGGQTVNGWCYVDNTEDPSTAKATIVEGCPSTEQRQIRFVGAGLPADHAITFITCEGQGQ
jgi:hypothetical protein